MSRQGTNNGGGTRWHLMPRGTCHICGLTKPVGVFQDESGYACHNVKKCEARRKKKERGAQKKNQEGDS